MTPVVEDWLDTAFVKKLVHDELIRGNGADAVLRKLRETATDIQEDGDWLLNPELVTECRQLTSTGPNYIAFLAKVKEYRDDGTGA